MVETSKILKILENEEIDLLFGFISLKTTHPGKDETETRLSKMEANETRPRRD